MAVHLIVASLHDLSARYSLEAILYPNDERQATSYRSPRRRGRPRRRGSASSAAALFVERGSGADDHRGDRRSAASRNRPFMRASPRSAACCSRCSTRWRPTRFRRGLTAKLAAARGRSSPAAPRASPSPRASMPRHRPVRSPARLGRRSRSGAMWKEGEGRRHRALSAFVADGTAAGRSGPR